MFLIRRPLILEKKLRVSLKYLSTSAMLQTFPQSSARVPGTRVQGDLVALPLPCKNVHRSSWVLHQKYVCHANHYIELCMRPCELTPTRFFYGLAHCLSDPVWYYPVW